MQKFPVLFVGAGPGDPELITVKGLKALQVAEVVAELLAGGVYTTDTPVAVVSKASWPDERIVEGTLADIAGQVAAAGIGRQALILVGEAPAARRRGVPEKSKLYDKDFFHGFRIKS